MQTVNYAHEKVKRGGNLKRGRVLAPEKGVHKNVPASSNDFPAKAD